MMGSSLLCLPWGFKNTGLVTGAALTCCTGACAFYTSLLILRWGAQAAQQYSDYGDVCGVYLGPCARHVCNLTSIAILLGVLACFHVVMATNIQAVIVSVGYMVGIPADFLCCGSGDNQYLTVSVLIGLLLSPLLCIRDIGRLAAVASYGVIAIFYNVILLVGTALVDMPTVIGHGTTTIQDVKLLGGIEDIGTFVGMIGLSLFVHASLLPMAGNHVHACTAPAVVRRDLGIAYAVGTFLYLIVGVFPALVFQLGRGVLPKYTDRELPQNSLLVFPESSLAALVGRLLVGMQCGVVYPILAAIARKQIFGVYIHTTLPEWKVFAAYNVVVIASTTLITSLYPYPGMVVGYVGTYTAVVYMLALPILVHLSALKKFGERTCSAVAGNLVLWAVGTGTVLLQFFV